MNFESWIPIIYELKLTYEAQVRFGTRVQVWVRRDLAIKKLLKKLLFIFLIYCYAYFFTLYKHIPNLRAIVDNN